ncbi:MAG: hypothetical protein HFI15_12485 [Lachnospiraceae bacterium]|jgi:hypothetical protein|nr:hypothetical protein [Lachnospiraceae bacterium]
MGRPGDSFGTCAYCGKQILWIRTKAGKNMPVDPVLISYCVPKDGRKGAEKIVTPAGEVICADRADYSREEGIGYISHFASCRKRERSGGDHGGRD